MGIDHRLAGDNAGLRALVDDELARKRVARQRQDFDKAWRATLHLAQSGQLAQLGIFAFQGRQPLQAGGQRDLLVAQGVVVTLELGLGGDEFGKAQTGSQWCVDHPLERVQGDGCRFAGVFQQLEAGVGNHQSERQRAADQRTGQRPGALTEESRLARKVHTHLRRRPRGRASGVRGVKNGPGGQS